MSVRLGVLAAAVATVFALIAVSAGAHSARYTGRVTIATNPVFHGSVISNRAGCEKRRAVRIYRVETGPDGLFTTTRTGSDGRWRYLSPSLTGDFYARVGARVVRSPGHRHVCNAARAGAVHVQP